MAGYESIINDSLIALLGWVPLLCPTVFCTRAMFSVYLNFQPWSHGRPRIVFHPVPTSLLSEVGAIGVKSQLYLRR